MRAWCCAGAFALAAFACGTHPASNPEAEPNDPEAEPPATPAVVCREPERANLLTQFAGPRCPWVLRSNSDGRVELLQSEPEIEGGLSGEAPEICAEHPCSYRGTHASTGPLVIVEVASSHSEMPAGAWLGFAHEGRLQFVDLWEDAGEPVIDGGIELGPAHALAPFDCDGALALLATPRTEAGEHVPVLEPLHGRERLVSGEPLPAARKGCRRVKMSMP